MRDNKRDEILLEDAASTGELETEDRQLRYRLDDRPNAGLCLVLAFQFWVQIDLTINLSKLQF